MASRVGASAVAAAKRIFAFASEFVASPHRWYRRRALRIWTYIFLSVLLGLTLGASLHLAILSSDRAIEIRRELFQRDLRDLVGRFDADERFALENNTAAFLTERRALYPLVLPRSYYTGLPASAGPVLPRQPPRNCFVYLEPEQGASSESDRFCSYFGESRIPGRYLYLAATFAEDDVVPLKAGDSKLMADAVRLDMSVNGQLVTWWLVFQSPPTPSRADRFEVTAFRQVGKSQRDRDRKIEGWAYLQRQVKRGARLYLIVRLDFREFSASQTNEEWPPPEAQSTTFRLSRKNMSSNSNESKLVRYRPTGRSELSLSSLGTQIFNSYGSIQLRKVQESGTKEWAINPPASVQGKLEPSIFGVKFSNGDLLLPATPTTESEAVPDTDMFVSVSHPWRLIEKGFWQILIYLVVLLVGGAFATAYFSRNLLTPIGLWARLSERLAKMQPDSDITLPFSERNNEIGDLATAFNALIRSVREQMARAQAEREEEIENRVQNLKVMGHEIRSPLQTLLAIHREPGDKSRRHIERMLAALPHLLGGESAIDAIGSRQLELKEFDLAAFLHAVAQNAEQADISDVQYLDRQLGVRCLADVGALEDALTNVLNNANRHRKAGTPIRMVLVEDSAMSGVEVWDDGDTITEENMERIFDFSFSTAEKTDVQGHGVGLYVARDYVRRMHGTIKVKNHKRGVVFTLMLPAAPRFPA